MLPLPSLLLLLLSCLRVSLAQAKHRRIRRWDVLWAVFNSAVRFFDMYRRRQQRMDSYLKVRRGGGGVCVRGWGVGVLSLCVFGRSREVRLI